MRRTLESWGTGQISAQHETMSIYRVPEEVTLKLQNECARYDMELDTVLHEWSGVRAVENYASVNLNGLFGRNEYGSSELLTSIEPCGLYLDQEKSRGRPWIHW